MATTFDQIFSGTRPHRDSPPPSYTSVYPTSRNARHSVSSSVAPKKYTPSNYSASIYSQNSTSSKSTRSSPSQRRHSLPPPVPPRNPQRLRARPVPALRVNTNLPPQIPPRKDVHFAPRPKSSSSHLVPPPRPSSQTKPAVKSSLKPALKSTKPAKSTKSSGKSSTHHSRRTPQPFVIWDGDDATRLPEGFKRIGYDTDDQTFYFQDRDGKVWQGKPGHEYGVLTPVSEQPEAAKYMPSGTTAGLKRARTVSNPDPKQTFDNILEGGKGRSAWGRLRGLSVRT